MTIHNNEYSSNAVNRVAYSTQTTLNSTMMGVGDAVLFGAAIQSVRYQHKLDRQSDIQPTLHHI